MHVWLELHAAGVAFYDISNRHQNRLVAGKYSSLSCTCKRSNFQSVWSRLSGPRRWLSGISELIFICVSEPGIFSGRKWKETATSPCACVGSSHNAGYVYYTRPTQYESTIVINFGDKSLKKNDRDLWHEPRLWSWTWSWTWTTAFSLSTARYQCNSNSKLYVLG